MTLRTATSPYQGQMRVGYVGWQLCQRDRHCLTLCNSQLEIRFAEKLSANWQAMLKRLILMLYMSHESKMKQTTGYQARGTGFDSRFRQTRVIPGS